MRGRGREREEAGGRGREREGEGDGEGGRGKEKEGILQTALSSLRNHIHASLCTKGSEYIR